MRTATVESPVANGRHSGPHTRSRPWPLEIDGRLPGRACVALPSLLLLLVFTSLARAADPPGKPYVLGIEGDSTVTFVPQANLPPVTIDYKAEVAYFVNTRTGEEAQAKAESVAQRRTAKKGSAKTKARAKAVETPEEKVESTVELAIHGSETVFRQNGQAVLESRISRRGFEGRLRPDAPALSVSAAEAPPQLQDVLRAFDTTSAYLIIGEGSRVLGRKVRTDTPFHAVTETLLSIHTPIPKDAAFWEAPTQLAMGQGQTAKGKLRFEKQKGDLAATGGLVKVKVTGTLKAEGVVVGRLVKDGRYKVVGDQSYDPTTGEWTGATWNVTVSNELANAGGVTVAHASGHMKVETKPGEKAAATRGADAERQQIP